MSIQSLGRLTEINFFSEQQTGLSVTIETDRLFLRSVGKEDLENYISLYGNEKVMGQVMTGKIKTAEETAQQVDTWIKKWQDSDPFSALSIFIKEPEEKLKFVGVAVLGGVNVSGESEMIGLGDDRFWNQGYGTEAANALVHDYAPELAEQSFKTKGNPLRKIVVMTNSDNGSETVVRKIGMQWIGAFDQYGAIWNRYSLKLAATPRNQISDLIAPPLQERPKSRSMCVLL